MFQIVQKNFGLKVLAVALAVTSWAYFHFSAAPSITAHFDQQLSVPIVVTGVHPGFVPTFSDRSAIVTVEVPRNGSPIKPEQIQAVLDVNDRTSPGIINVPVKIVAPDLPIKSLSPASVTMNLERIESRNLPVNISYLGGNGSLVVVSANVNPIATTLHGVGTDLAKVETVKIDIPLGTKPGVYDAMVRPVPADARGNEVAGVTISPNFVRVTARFGAASNSAGVKR